MFRFPGRPDTMMTSEEHIEERRTALEVNLRMDSLINIFSALYINLLNRAASFLDVWPQCKLEYFYNCQIYMLAS